MPSFIKNLLYGISVFGVFIVIAATLKLISGNTPENADYFGLFTNSDITLGLVVAVVVTFTHIKKMKNK